MTDEQLKKKLEKNLAFHAIVTSEVNDTPYGQITVNVKIQGGTVVLDTLNIVKNKRKKYKLIDKQADGGVD